MPKECGVLCAPRWKRSERIKELECETAFWTFRAICKEKPIARGARPAKIGDRFGQSPGVHANCVVSVLPPMPVFVTGGSRQSVIQQTSLHEDSSGHHNTMRVSV